MSACEHDWRETIFGIRCERCTRVVSVGWLLDELSDVTAERDDLRRRAEHMEADEQLAADWRAHVAEWEANKIAEARAAALEEAATLAREHGAISVSYRLQALARGGG